ncbi:MAG: LTA synthase family protein [Bacteroidales bacterium]|nr:LTA synthase family protein [Bacteroidales bacterium]
MLNKTWYTGNTYAILALKLLFVLFLLSVSRMLIYFFNVSLFSDIRTGHLIYISLAGLRFDLFTLVIANFPFIVLNAIPLALKYNKTYQSLNNVLFYILNALALMVNFIDIIYFRFTLKRMTFDIFDYVDGNSNEIISLIPDFIHDFWFPFLLYIFFVILLVWVGEHVKIDYKKQKHYRLKNYLFDSIKFVFIAILFVIVGRGGLQYKPTHIVDAGQHTKPRYFPIILNTPFTIIKTKDESGIAEKSYYRNKEELDMVFSPVQHSRGIPEDFNDQNIVILVLESFTSEHSRYLNPTLQNGKYQGYTPFLDSLMKQSLTFRGFANGQKSIEGIPAIISGIPSLMNSPYLISPYAGNEINSLPGMLKSKGYTSAFYHGGTNGTMSFESYTKIAGFDKYYGRYEYDNDEDFDGKWGIFDEEYLQYTANMLDVTEEPFMACIFTLSSHHPYTIPDKHKDRFPKGTLKIHESIGYTDYSLRMFFNSIKKSDWFNNTLFVITADHTYGGKYPFYKTSVGDYAIPVVFYHHNEDWEKLSGLTVQQTDILPSLLDYLNYDKDYVAFGQSVFDSISDRFAISYLSGVYQMIQGDYAFEFDGEKDISLFNYKIDSLLSVNLIHQEDSITTEMGKLSRAIVQQYNDRMIHNELTVKE